LMEGFMYRHHPQTKRLKELVIGGAIGDPRLVRTHFSFTLGRASDPRWDPALGGGALLDLGCYCVNASRLLVGEPQVVYAEQTLAPGGADVRFAATMRFPGGVLGHFDCAFDLPFRAELEIVGSDASLRLSLPFVADDVGLELRRGDEVEPLPRVAANRYGCELDNLARAIRGQAEPLLGRLESVAQARVLDALLRSAGGASPVRLA
jgi:xylose dehydrogenase (NAD/NADP)